MRVSEFRDQQCLPLQHSTRLPSLHRQLPVGEPCHEVHYNRLMSDAEVERLYRAMEALRIEVVQYRADLNGRLRTLEVHSAEVDAREDQRVMTRSATLAYIAGIAAVTGIISAVVTNLL